VFLCIDVGRAKRPIIEKLEAMNIPFIDVGMGLNRKEGSLAGTLRATYYAPENAAKVREMKLAEMADDPNDCYRRNVQISELNAVNAWLAIIRYKQLRGFYVDDSKAYHLLMDTTNLRLFAEVGP